MDDSDYKEPLSDFSKEKLTELADIIHRADRKYKRWLREGKCPIKGAMFGYNQRADVMHPCGTPGCAWGHWLKAHPEDGPYHESVDWEKPFEITHPQMLRLFDYNGCGDAGTDAVAAVRFIRKAVREGAL